MSIEPIYDGNSVAILYVKFGSHSDHVIDYRVLCVIKNSDEDVIWFWK